MSSSIPFPGSLLAAQAVTYAKGHEVGFTSSTEKAEKAREQRKILQGMREAEQRKKASGAQKGTLA